MRLFIGRTFAFGNRTFQTRPEGAFSCKVSERWEKALGKSNKMQKTKQTNKKSKRKYAPNPDHEQFLVTVKNSLYSKLN